MKNQIVSLIMVNYNGKRHIGEKDFKEAVISFLNVDYPKFEFVFVDNNSDDGSVEIVKAIFKEYSHIETRIVQTYSNLGFAGGCNKGIEHSKGDYICLINNDDKALDGYWLEKLLDCANSHQVDVVFCKKMQWDNPSEIDAVGMRINPIGFPSAPDPSEIYRIQCFPCLIWQTPVLIRRNVVEKIGGLFDNDYVILHDDTDSSLRIWLAGCQIFCNPLSLVLHKRSATMKSLPVEFVAFHGRKNILQTLVKCYELKNLIKWLPLTITVYLVSIGYHISIRRLDQARATTKALIWTGKNINKLLRKRNFVQKKVRRITDKELFKLMKPFQLSEMVTGEKVWPR